MGTSGIGKITILNVLSQRIDFGIIIGDLLINSTPFKEELVLVIIRIGWCKEIHTTYII